MRQITMLFAVAAVLATGCSSGTTDTTTTASTSTTTTVAAATTTLPLTTTVAPTTTAAPPTTAAAAPVDGKYRDVTTDVTTDVVSHETTEDIWVWAPDGEGPWPIVFAWHGRGGTGDGLATTAENLASNGVLVFAPTYRSTEPQYIEGDLECAYRYALSIAEDYGGDLDQPITSFGHSMGASLAIYGGLNGDAYGPGGTYDECFAGVQRPDVIVAVTGCHYENEDGDRYPFDTTGYSNLDADLVIVGATDDHVCELWQSQDATEALQAAGYSARLVEIDDGNHGNVVFYEVINGEWLVRPNDPVGHEVVQLTIDAIDAAQ